MLVGVILLSLPMEVKAVVGDINGDGIVDIVDVQAVINIFLGNTAPTVTAPGAPTSVTATGGNAQATVVFTAPASNGGSAITGYTVSSIPVGGVDSNAGTTALSHTVTGLTNNTSYTFTVTATNTAGTSVASAASNAVTPAAPTTSVDTNTASSWA